MGMNFTGLAGPWPLAAGLQLVPLLAALLLMRLRGQPAFGLALLAVTLELGLATALYLHFDPGQAAGVMQFSEHLPLFGALQYHAGVDGMSVLFVLLSAVLGFLSVVFVLFRQLHGTTILAVIMALQATLMSQFLTLDLLWFCLMGMLQVLLTAYLSWRWPTSADVLPALSRYLQFMFTGLLLLLGGTLILGWSHADQQGGGLSFDLFALTRQPVPDSLQELCFFLLFYGLAVRIPLFPLHGWLPDLLMQGSVAIVPISLLGLKVGVYGLLRFVFPILPQAVEKWHFVAAGFAMIGVFYAALLALRSTNLRRLLGYAVISHTGILTVGLFALHPSALKGSLLLALNFGLAISGLLLMTGLVWQRTSTTNLLRLGGMFDHIPLVGVAFLVAGLAIVGMPGTPGFDAVHFVLEGSILSFGATVTIAAALGNLIAAGFLLHSFQRAFMGAPPGNRAIHWNTSPSQLTEKVLAGTVILVTLAVGFYSKPWLELINQPVQGLGALFAAEAPTLPETLPATGAPQP